MSKYTDRIDMRFHYVPAASTDIRETFARFRREQRAKAEAEKAKPQARIIVMGKGAK